MTIIRKHEELMCKQFEHSDDILKWANEKKKYIDIITITYTGQRIFQSTCGYVWFKVKKALDKAVLE